MNLYFAIINLSKYYKLTLNFHLFFIQAFLLAVGLLITGCWEHLHCGYIGLGLK